MEITQNHTDTINSWRQEAETSLRAEHNWLSLVGLFWLEEGENPFGANPESSITLPNENTPDKAGVFTLKDGKITVRIADGVDARIEDQVVIEAEMKPDTSEEPDYLYIGGLKMGVIERGQGFAIRVWDEDHPKRLNFKGRNWYAIDDEYRVTAKIAPYESPKKVPMVNQIGDHFDMEMYAELSFTINGREHTLDATQLSSGALYIMLKDETSKSNTYPSGRYLVTEIPEGDEVVIDFNKAYSPPCAFTDFATCTLPPPQNTLDAAIKAGEIYKIDG